MCNTRLALGLVLILWSVDSQAAPHIAPGDLALRHDIRLLADAGIISGPVTTWPLAWGPIAADILGVEIDAEMQADVLASLMRVRARANWETRTDEIIYRAKLSVAESPNRIRSFLNTPRESGEIGGRISWTGNRLSLSLGGQIVDSPADGEDYRADGSSIGAVFGNFSISANTLDRWWGPGWDGSLILSNNARSIPAISIDRNFTDPFKTRWLSWLGPWDFVVHYGQLESARVIPNARFFGMRFNFRPIHSLEIGLSRAAQWCGNGRPCGFDTFSDLLIGTDNRGGQGVNLSNEPGNQLAGVDFRWSTSILDLPLAIYGQFIGEDEAGGFPSRYLGQFGIETSGMLGDRWSYRWFGEFAGTSCQFHESSEIFNCAYNHSIYQSGYRYRGRVVGHAADNDARIVSTGLTLVDADETQWVAMLRFGALNRGSIPDLRNSLTSTRQDIASLDLTHTRTFQYGLIDVGLGIESVEDKISGTTSNDARVYLQWRSSY